MSRMTPLRALIEARKLLNAKSRWTQGAFAKTKEGNVIGPNTNNAACFCSLGALYHVAPTAPKARNKAEILLNNICLTLHFQPIVSFNDYYHITHKDVLKVFDTAIKELQHATP